jgi:hypothetical protein
MFKLVAAVTFAASLAASAQMDMKPSGNQSTDKEKIADALRAGPPFIVKDAVIADWPADPKAPNAEYRVLRAGKSDWTCLPGIPGYPHDDPCAWIRHRCNGSGTASRSAPYTSTRSGSCTCSPEHGYRTCMEHLTVPITLIAWALMR